MGSRIYYDLIRQRVAHAALEAATAATMMDHPGLAGQIREITLRNCILPFLTHSFRCGTGKIIDTTGHITRQIDLIVYQTKVGPPILFNPDFGVFPAECCSYAFEVKSTLNANEIKKSLVVMESVCSLKRFPQSDPSGRILYKNGPVTTLFAFGSDISGDELHRYLVYDVNRNPRFTSIIVLNKGYWFFHEDLGWHGVTIEDFDYPEGIFMCFIAGFCNTLAQQEASLTPFRPGSYMLEKDKLLQPYLQGNRALPRASDAHPQLRPKP